MRWGLYAFVGVALFLPSLVFGEIDEDLARKYAVQYPPEQYIIGIGVVQVSDDSYKARRRSEILARLELAKVVRVFTRAHSIDIACEGKGTVVFDNEAECQNQIVQIVEETVDEVLEGSTIVGTGEEKTKGLYYSIAVLPKKGAAAKAEEGSKEAIEKAEEHIANSKKAENEDIKKEEAQKAKEELKKSLAFDSQKEAIEQVRQNADDLFKSLALESVLFR